MGDRSVLFYQNHPYRIIAAPKTLGDIGSANIRNAGVTSRIYARAIGMGVAQQGRFLNDQAGHVVANALGGLNCPINMFPQSIGSNAHVGSQWKEAESIASDRRRSGCTTKIFINFRYNDGDDGHLTRTIGGTYNIKWKSCNQDTYDDDETTIKWGNIPPPFQ